MKRYCVVGEQRIRHLEDAETPPAGFLFMGDAEIPSTDYYCIVHPTDATKGVWDLDTLKQANRLRSIGYPTVEDQLLMQFNDLVNTTTTWQDAIQVVHDEFPLPS